MIDIFPVNPPCRNPHFPLPSLDHYHYSILLLRRKSPKLTPPPPPHKNRGTTSSIFFSPYFLFPILCFFLERLAFLLLLLHPLVNCDETGSAGRKKISRDVLYSFFFFHCRGKRSEFLHNSLILPPPPLPPRVPCFDYPCIPPKLLQYFET